MRLSPKPAGETCCSKRGRLHESSSEVGGTAQTLALCARSVSSSRHVISAQNDPFCARRGLKKKKEKKETQQNICRHGVCFAARVACEPSAAPLLFYFDVFPASHPVGCRNVETECFKNSILSSDKAAPAAPRHCGATSGNAKMATDLGELLVPYMPTIRVPKTGDRVFKSECAFSFDSPVSVRHSHTHTHERGG